MATWTSLYRITNRNATKATFPNTFFSSVPRDRGFPPSSGGGGRRLHLRDQLHRHGHPHPGDRVEAQLGARAGQVQADKHAAGTTSVLIVSYGTFYLRRSRQVLKLNKVLLLLLLLVVW